MNSTYQGGDEEEDDDGEGERLMGGGRRREEAQEGEGGTEKWRVVTSFFLFGLINNVLYVIILSAALDLVSTSTPKGVVAFFNIFPALVAKVGWPYILKGRVRYRRRVASCALLSFIGMLTISFSSNVSPRMLGISLASFSSGLGELTFLQLSSSYPSNQSLGGFASGTGGAGIVGAGLWWLVKGWGVQLALGVFSILPLGMVLTMWLVLKPGEHIRKGRGSIGGGSGARGEGEDEDEEDQLPKLVGKQIKFALNAKEKWALARPLIFRFMFPLFFVYVFEYSINQGIAPTLLYPLPTSGILSHLIKSPRDFYPLYQLTYQTFVFLSRSSHIIGIPPLPLSLLSTPSILQGFILLTLFLEAKAFHPFLGISLVLVVISIEGLCGGLAYVNAFHHVGRIEEGVDEVGVEARRERERRGEVGEVRRVQEREWRIGVVGAADSWGVLIASLIAMPLELSLCQAQVDMGRDTCRTL
ncbi:CLN3 protein-domain-containing protein [Mrakia frigida]|uniref:amino acid transporter YHC3 n=1 Tax=Mrakia frigida TaxID=29902 RepID=UPI003FCBFE33